MKRPNIVNVEGQRFGRLVAVRRVGSRGVKSDWLCLCDCGKTKMILYQSLRDGTTRSCGCLRAEHARAIGRRYAKRTPDASGLDALAQAWGEKR